MAFLTDEADRVSLTALDSSNSPVTGATVTLAIRNIDTGDYFNGTAFVGSYQTVAMVETDATNLPGVYHYDFNPPIDDIRVQYYAQTSTLAVVNAPWRSEQLFGKWADQIIKARKVLSNRLLENIGSGTATLFDDDGVTPLFVINPFVVGERGGI
jgi:hypothetical protein